MDIGYHTVIIASVIIFVVPAILLKPQLLLYALIFSTMFPSYFRLRVSFGSTNIYIEDIFLAFYCISAGCLILKRVVTKESIIDLSKDAIFIFGFVIGFIVLHLSLIVVAWNQGVPVTSAVRRFLPYASCLYFFFPFLFLKNKDQYRKLLTVMIFVSVLYPFWQIYLYIEGGYTITSSGTIRLAGAGVPIISCSLFAMLIWKEKTHYNFLAINPILAILLKGHRSFFLALVLCLFILIVWTRGIFQTMVFLCIGSIGLIFSFLIVEAYTGHSFMEDFIKRGADTFDSQVGTTKARLSAIEDTIYVFKKKPLLGIGYHFEVLPKILRPTKIAEKQNNVSEFAEWNVLHPHNFVLNFLSRTGIVGSFLVFSIIILVLKTCYSFTQLDGMIHKKGVFLFCSILFFILVSLMNSTFTSEGFIFWLLCGVVALFSAEENRKKNEAEEI